MEGTQSYQRIPNDPNRKKINSSNSNESDFGPRKTIIVLAIVAGCFAVLWPKIFYPMLSTTGSSTHSNLDASVCCDIIFEPDVNAVDILQEMCKNILKHHQVDPRVRDVLQTNKLSPQSASFCREQVLARCGIDLSTFLAEKERLGKSYKQVLEEIRSFNSSVCLKVHFGVPLSRLGTPHLIRYHVLMPHTPIRQERRLPPHAGGLHPAMRERGRAIPSSHIVPKVEGRPEHVVVQKMRPPMGGPGRVVPPQGGGGSSMGIIMPLYTIGILLFFVYTIAKVLRKNSNNEIYAEYSRPEAEREFRDRVFNPELLSSAITGMSYYRKESSPPPIKRIPTIEELKQQDPGDIEVDQLIQRLADTEAAMERIVVQMGNLSRTVVQNSSSQPAAQGECTDKNCCSIGKHDAAEESDAESSPTVKVVGMEMTASCEGGQKISRPTTPVICHSPNLTEREKTPPKPIYLEGSLPPQCELLVTDSETQAENPPENAEAPVVLSGKMTLSLISLDQNSADSKNKNSGKDNADGILSVERANKYEEISHTEVQIDKNVVDYDDVDSEEKIKNKQTEDNEDNIKNLKIEKRNKKIQRMANHNNESEEKQQEKEDEDNQINQNKIRLFNEKRRDEKNKEATEFTDDSNDDNEIILPCVQTCDLDDNESSNDSEDDNKVILPCDLDDGELSKSENEKDEEDDDSESNSDE